MEAAMEAAKPPPRLSEARFQTQTSVTSSAENSFSSSKESGKVPLLVQLLCDEDGWLPGGSYFLFR
jgi:hypothetical protein